MDPPGRDLLELVCRFCDDRGEGYREMKIRSCNISTVQAAAKHERSTLASPPSDRAVRLAKLASYCGTRSVPGGLDGVTAPVGLEVGL